MDFVEYPISSLPCSQQSQFVEFHYKSNGGIRSVAEVLFQLLGGKFFCTV